MLLITTCSCAGTSASSKPNKAVVTFVGQPVSADLIVDGQFVSTVALARGGLALKPGFHTFELRADTYMSEFIELTLRPGVNAVVPFQLVPELP
jgi:ABC-type amino acid transport system permease subunit